MEAIVITPAAPAPKSLSAIRAGGAVIAEYMKVKFLSSLKLKDRSTTFMSNWHANFRHG